MGLDMYLDKHFYQSTFQDGKKVPRKKIDGLDVKEIVCEAICWRKANEIHKWFVENVQNGQDDCRSYEVGVDQLKELLALIRKVIRTKNTALLPTSGGFFFGSTDYGDYYWQDLKRTARELAALIKNHDEKSPSWFTYSSSW